MRAPSISNAAAGDSRQATDPLATESFRIAGFYGEVVGELRPVDLRGEIEGLVDPATADETIHWGRNYLYRTHLQTPSGRLAVVVKQFRNQGWKARLRRRHRGSKAEASWRMACTLAASGIRTAAPVMLIESEDAAGPSFFVSTYLPGLIEARYIFRAVQQGTLDTTFPELDYARFLEALGQAIRRMHDVGFFHRDLSIGNVLLPEPNSAARRSDDKHLSAEDLTIIDLNRGRTLEQLSTSQRTRDLCRLAIFRPQDQERFLAAYWGPDLGSSKKSLYRFYHRGFLFKIESKKKVRAALRGLLAPFRPRRAHVHIPQAPKDATSRDKIVWDHLSDQPHQHAGRFEKTLVRLWDLPSHVKQNVTTLAAVPRVWHRYRQLERNLYQEPVDWAGVGVCIRPHEEDPEALLMAIEDLGVKHLLLRLHPWQEDHRHEEELAAELHRRGYDLAFVLPQNRELVRDPKRWRASIEKLAAMFTPYGRHFQVGQAINRSKWGIWHYGEYLQLAAAACDVLRRYPGIEILGPSVIDFEPHATAGVLNRRHPGVFFDVVASLLYVDRRGAPENKQLGFDSIGKAMLVKAIADTARNCAPRSWITEVNWPLWEGPHSPAGKTVSVDEESQANYLARFYLLTLASGTVERVYWWQMIARGYGLIAPQDAQQRGGLRRRASFQALATLAKTLFGSRFEGPIASPPGTYVYSFSDAAGQKISVGWSRRGSQRVDLPLPPQEIIERDGSQSSPPQGNTVQLNEAVRYFRH